MNEKEATVNKKCTDFAKKQKISEFSAFDNLFSPSVVENSAWCESRGEQLIQHDVNAKEKYEGEQQTANVDSMKLGGGKDFLYDANLEGNVNRVSLCHIGLVKDHGQWRF